jgi:hypothetical protein
MTNFSHVVSVAFTVNSADAEGKDFTPDMLRAALLARVADLDNSPRGSEWIEAAQVEDTAETQEDSPPVEHEYEFGLKIFATLKIKATSEDEAVAMIENSVLESGNIGMFSDGSPVVITIDDVEDCKGGSYGAVMIDGQEV